MPEEGVKLTEKTKILSTPEIVKLASMFVGEGVNKIRLTGGEPTVRKDLEEIIGKKRSYIFFLCWFLFGYCSIFKRNRRLGLRGDDDQRLSPNKEACWAAKGGLGRD